MALAKLNKRTVDALAAPATGQEFLWDTEIKGFGIRVGATGTKTFVIQYMNEEGRVRRVKIGRFGVMTVEQARDLAKIQLGKVASGEDPAEESRRVRKELNVAEMCEWYLVEARAGRILGRKNRPIKESSLNGGKVALAGLGRVGEALGRMLEPYANRPSTVIKYADTPIGVLFL